MQFPSRYTANKALHNSSLRSGNNNPECRYAAQLHWSTNTLLSRAQSCARQYAILQPRTVGPQLPGDTARTTAQLSKLVNISGLSRLFANLYYLAEYAFKMLEWQLLSPLAFIILAEVSLIILTSATALKTSAQDQVQTPDAKHSGNLLD